jgi:hypothetical protein
VSCLCTSEQIFGDLTVIISFPSPPQPVNLTSRSAPADKFDPDRFLDERVKTYITPNPFIFLPFNAGPRICLGQQFAYHESSFFLIRFLQRFTNIQHVLEAQPPASRPPVEWKSESGPKGRDDVCIKSQLTMSVKGGMWVTMEEAGITN